jgi:hypothetical protein
LAILILPIGKSNEFEMRKRLPLVPVDGGNMHQWRANSLSGFALKAEQGKNKEYHSCSLIKRKEGQHERRTIPG